LCVYLPAQADSNDSLLGLLERRDEVIRSLLKKHCRYWTDVAVLVADLQSSVRICTELPPEEYFEDDQPDMGRHGAHFPQVLRYTWQTCR